MNVLSLFLLQVETTTFMTKLVDQAFTIVCLATTSWLLWQRITKVQDRMDTYLSEDRKEMSEVIKNNTEVMKEVLNTLKLIEHGN